MDAVWTGLIAAGAAIVAALATFLGTVIVKRLEERRLNAQLALDRDLRSAELFVSLMNRANARGETVVLSEVAQVIAQSALFTRVLTDFSNAEPGTQERLNLGSALDVIMSSTVVNAPVGRAAQVAAGQMAAALADRYDFLRPAAIAGLREIQKFIPETDVSTWEKAWSIDTGGALKPSGQGGSDI